MWPQFLQFSRLTYQLSPRVIITHSDPVSRKNADGQCASRCRRRLASVTITMARVCKNRPIIHYAIIDIHLNAGVVDRSRLCTCTPFATQRGSRESSTEMLLFPSICAIIFACVGTEFRYVMHSKYIRLGTSWGTSKVKQNRYNNNEKFVLESPAEIVSSLILPL